MHYLTVTYNEQYSFYSVYVIFDIVTKMVHMVSFFFYQSMSWSHFTPKKNKLKKM